MVTKTCANGPVGPRRLPGRLSSHLRMPSQERRELRIRYRRYYTLPSICPPAPTLILQKIAQCGALYFVLPCLAVMRLLPEVSPQAAQRTKTESTAIGNEVCSRRAQ